MNPLVTVCITTFNRIELLPRAVKSVLQQTFDDFELIIVDDLSTDQTEEWVKQAMEEDNRIRYIRHETNQGLAAARNTAIFNAKGKYFSFVDDDDQWTERYLEEFVKVADQYDPQWCFCCGSITTDLLGQTVFGRYDCLEGELRDFIQQGYTPPIASQFYFTETLIACGGYDTRIKSGVDHDLWLNLAFNGIKIKSVDQYLSIPSEAIDFKRNKMTNSYEKRIHGITNSLNVWREKIEQHYGEAFFQRFVNAYLLREKKKFLRIYLMNFQFKPAYKLYLKIKNQTKLSEVIKSLAIAVILNANIPVRRKKYGIRGPNLASTGL
jgi:glycosyltransferase involved in cell wall biosynthesis